MSLKAIYFTALSLLGASIFAEDVDKSPSAVEDTTNEDVVQIVKNSALGDILTDNKGMTLYMFTKDRKNKSNCYGKCAKAWPPLSVKAAVSDVNTLIKAASKLRGKLGLVMRRDKTRQVTFNGMPLYYYIKDKKAGDTTGQKLQNQWYVVKAEKSATGK